MDVTDQGLQQRIVDAKAATLAWLETLQAERLPYGVSRVSQHHNPAHYPQMLLPGSYDATMCRTLLNAPIRQASGLANWLMQHQQADGFFVLPELDWNECYKKPSKAETQDYMRFHITNYSLGALEALGRTSKVTLPFLVPFLHEEYLWAWLGRRDMRDPWLEGNNIVNLASFFIFELQRQPDSPAKQRLNDMVRWHQFQSEPYSGFYGPGQQFSQRALLHALCGATHNFHLFYYLNEEIDHFNQSVSRCLEQPIAIQSACIDVDIVDILAHGAQRFPERRDEIEFWLRGMLTHLLSFQNNDGGFADTLLGERRFDGWVQGYREPQGISNTFATWFRWIAIAMIAETLWPDWQQWNFRTNIGIGYFRKFPTHYLHGHSRRENHHEYQP